MIPVMMIRIGATSAESTPPAPNSIQNIGSLDRFISHPPHDYENQGGKPARQGGPPPCRDDQRRQQLPTDTNVGRGLGRHLPPGVGVVSDGQQREPVKYRGSRTRQRREPGIVSGLALSEPREPYQQDERVYREKHAAPFANHVAHKIWILAPPSLHGTNIGFHLRHQVPPLGIRNFSKPK